MSKPTIYGVVALSAVMLGLGSVAAEAASTAVEEIRIIGRRLPDAVNEPVYRTSILDRTALSSGAAVRLDDTLRQVPGFGLFRRQSSRAAHPTTQGVSLRGLGPSGAGRTLVLLDGVPQNDPFGGWIDWSRLPSAAFESVAITRGGGAGPWGNAALAGVVRLESRVDPQGSGWGEARVDSFGAVDGTVSAHMGAPARRFFAIAHGHTGEGPYLIRKDQRGPVDRNTLSEGAWLQLGGSFALDDATTVTTVANYSRDRFINGLDIVRSRTRIADGSVGIVHENADGPSWEAHAYFRDQGFASTFGSVNDTRTVVTPALDQFAVPATGAGANGILRVPVSTTITLQAGADLRYASGATHEYFTFVAGNFTRQRRAGGKQTLAGGYAEVDWQPTSALIVTAGGRIDYWKQHDGARREIDRATAAILRNDVYADSDGSVGNFRVGARMDFGAGLSGRATVYSGFRVPTLNELYRPFRVGNDITEANAALRPERMLGGEAGLEWQLNDVSLGVTYFHTRLKDAVTNITIQTTPGQNAELGVFVPAGGVLRQRRNLARIEADGIEAEAAWPLADNIEMRLSYLYTSPEVTRSIDQPGLVGLRVAQVAKHQASASLAWRPAERWLLKLDGRIAGSQFEDDLNIRTLKGYVTLDGYVDYALTRSASLYVAVENAFDETIEAGRSATGLVTVGSPQTFAGGVRLRF